MALIVLTNNGVDQTNIDDARDYQFNAGNRDGIVKGAFNEGKFIATASNVISFDTCEMRISGHRVINNSAWTKTFTSLPSANERHALVLHLVVDDNSAVTASFIDRLVSVTPTQDKLYEHANGAGTYEVEIGRFTLTTAGLVEDVVRTLDIITGNSRSGYPFDIGTVTAETLDANVPAEADAEFRDDPEQGKTFLDIYLGIPAGATIDTITAGTPTQSSGQTVTPITMTLTDGTTRTFDITATNGQTGATGVGISSITAGTPTQSGGQTVTPITITLTDGNTLSFNITSVNGTNGTNGTNGASVTNVQLTLVNGSTYKVTTTLSNGTTIDSGNIIIPNVTIDNALSTTSENSVQNKVITDAINKLDYSLTLTHNVASTDNAKYLIAKFLTIDYSNYTNGKGACIKLKAKSFKSGSMYNYGDDARNFIIDEDIIIQKDGGSSTLVSIYRYDTIRYWWSFNNHGCTFGDIFWTDDTTNKVLNFYMFCGENSSTQFTPYTSMNATTPTGITQHTGNAEYYSSGTINWAQFGLGTRVALKSEVDHVEDSLPSSGALVPIGSVLPFAGTSIPNNWLYCGGQAVSRTEYAKLYEVIGTRFGTGNGSTTFNVPNLIEKFIFGANLGNPSISDYTVGVTGGSKDAVAVWHDHTFSGTNVQARVGGFRVEGNQSLSCEAPFSADNSLLPSDKDYWDSPDNDWRLQGFKFNYTPSGTVNANGTDGTGKNMPPYMCLYYIIRAK